MDSFTEMFIRGTMLRTISVDPFAIKGANDIEEFKWKDPMGSTEVMGVHDS